LNDQSGIDRRVPNHQIERQQDLGGARGKVFFPSLGCALPSPSSRGSVSSEAAVGMAVYTARAVLHGKGGNVWEMMVENIP
jgi:hypothetical protein